MEYTGQIILACLEEDNVQRAYFRVRPLLTATGALSQEDVAALPDEGYMRIVPDKNEQHTFKDRMRELGAFCMLNLRDFPPDANKIRTNKNYAPNRGECNQFIVYSDAVQPVMPTVVYEVIAAEENTPERMSAACTPLCYTRVGGRIQGPYSRATGLAQEGAGQLAPDSEGLYAVTLPSGQEKLFYWPGDKAQKQPAPAPAPVPEAPVAEEKPAPAQATNAREQIESLDAPVSENANRLSGASRPAQVLPQGEQKKLVGTPLYQSVAKRPPQVRAHNALSEIVDAQVRAGRAEAPGAVLQQGARLRQVENPVDHFKRSLAAVWAGDDTRQQALDAMLSLTGIQPMLSQALSGKSGNAVIAAMHSQLQDLEAERLTMLLQLDEAKKGLAALRKEALEKAHEAEKQALDKARAETEAAKIALDTLEGKRTALVRERDELLREMAAAGDTVTRVAGQVGGGADMRELCARVMAALRGQGFVCAWDDAVNLIVLYAISPRLLVKAPTVADALTAARALCEALGGAFVCQRSFDDKRVFCDGGDAPIIVASARGDGAPSADYSQFLLSGEGGLPEYPAPAALFTASEAWDLPMPPAPCQPVKVSAIKTAALGVAAELPKPAVELMTKLLAELAANKAPLPQAQKRLMQKYLRACAAHMEGGVATAMDYAVCAFLYPHALASGVPLSSLLANLAGLPRALALFTK